MKFLLIAMLLATPAVALPTEDDYCAYIAPELEQAVIDGLIERHKANSILERCLRLHT